MTTSRWLKMPTTLDDLMSLSPAERAIVEIDNRASSLMTLLKKKFDASLGLLLGKKVTDLKHRVLSDPLATIDVDFEFGEFSRNALGYVQRFADIDYPLDESLTRNPPKIQSIEFNLDYDLVKRYADEIYKSAGFVTWLQVAKAVGYTGNGGTIGNYLRRWGEENRMSHTTANMGHYSKTRGGGHITVYYKGKRPPVSPTERVKAAIGRKKMVDLDDILEKASLPGLELSKRSVQIILGSMGYKAQSSQSYKNPEY